jgi:hypothetical protein
MQQVPKGCLIAFLGALALIFDSLFVAAFMNVQSHGDHIVCRPSGCGTMLVPMIMLGLFGGISSLAFVGLLLKRDQ